jgi:ribonuclease D
MTTTVQVDLLKIYQTVVAIAEGVRILLSREVDCPYTKNDLKVNDSNCPPSAHWWKTLCKTLNDFDTLLELSDNFVEFILLDESLHDPLLWEEFSEASSFLLTIMPKYKENLNPIEFADEMKMLQKTTNACQLYSKQLWMIAADTNCTLPMDSVDGAKPQTIYSHLTPPVIKNSRTKPFIPKVNLEKPFGITPLPIIEADTGEDQSKYLPLIRLCEGHGLVDFDNELDLYTLSPDVVAPSEHCPHLYAPEIQSFQYTDDQLKVHDSENSIPPLSSHTSQQNLLIETVLDLKKLVEEIVISNVTNIAVSLINHSYRSFSGFVTVMSISFPVHSTDLSICNYLVDTLKLDPRVINQYMAPMFAHPGIAKIIHGASDTINWLQRDFGIYVVNLFDTREAARLLAFPFCTYDYLVKMYCDSTVMNNKLLIHDWRQRPLNSTMQTFAVDRARFLLPIYDRIKIDLCSSGDSNMVRSVFDIGRTLTLRRYTPKPFIPSGYEVLIPSTLFSDHDPSMKQKRVLRRLWNWRDTIAREHDESIHYVCNSSFLRELAIECPKTVTELKSLNSAKVPSYVFQYSREIICCIKDAVEKARLPEVETLSGLSVQCKRSDFQQVEETQQNIVSSAPSSAFFKPMNASNDLLRSREMMSPVLGTEALYNQAGWISPHEQNHQTQSPISKHMTNQLETSNLQQGLNITGSRSRSSFANRFKCS